MLLTIDQIREVTTGVEEILQTENGYDFIRFTSAEASTTDNINLHHPAGVQMEFVTDAKSIYIQVETTKLNDTRSYFSFDIFENGKCIGNICNFEQSHCLGNYAEQKYPLGVYEKRFDLNDGEKKVKIVFPFSVKVFVKKIELTDASKIIPCKRSKRLVAYGDSITQGYDALHPSDTYIYKFCESLNMELVSKALGGAIFDYNIINACENPVADLLVVAFGTNDWSGYTFDKIITNVKAFFEAVSKKYSNVPVIVITPIWRKDCSAPVNGVVFEEVEKLIKNTCIQYENMNVISGISLVEHNEEFFGDLRLHPNASGFEQYTHNLLAHYNALADA